jgi:hypothetical protein
MTLELWLGVAALVIQMIVAIFLLGQWKSSRENTDVTTVMELRREVRDREEQCKRLEGSVELLNSTQRELRSIMQVYEIRWAVLRIQLQLPPWPGEDV